MKKILLLMALSIGIYQVSNAQKIELVGVGIKVNDSPVLMIDDPGSVDYVVVEAAAIFPYETTGTPGEVVFTSDGVSKTSGFAKAGITYSTVVSNPQIISGKEYHWGYYTANFNSVDGAGIALNKMEQTDSIISLVAYVYRTNGDPSMVYQKMGKPEHVFHNGSGNPLVYTFNLPAIVGNRNIEVTVPITDLESDHERWANVKVTAGTLVADSSFSKNNVGELLHLEKLNINDVPESVTEIKVEIYSPIKSDNLKEGDSFITSGVVLTVEEHYPGCSLTQGYWKTHGDIENEKKYDETWDKVGGPNADFFESEQSYMEVLNTPPSGGNAYYILAHQYIATELNFKKGSGAPSVVLDAFEEATSLFGEPNNYTPAYIGGLAGDNPIRKEFIRLAEILDDYNNGIIGPGHCGEDEAEEEVEKVEVEQVKVNNGKAKGKNKSGIVTADNDFVPINEVAIYPNPVKNTATISFNPVYDGKATVELYNSMGQRTSRLLDQNVQKDIPVSLKLDGHEYKEGLYIVRIQNGSSSKTVKIKINK